MRTKNERNLYRLVVLTAVVLAAAVPLAASEHQTPLEDPIPEPIEAGPLVVQLEVVTGGMTAPNWGTSVPGCEALDDRLVVTDQVGILWAVDVDDGASSVLLDVSDRLVDLGVGGPGTFDERGFLGVAFHPDFALNGLLYTYTSEPVDGPADFSTLPAGESANHQSVVTEWQVPSPCEIASVVDPASAREVLRIDQPQFNHDGGALVFGPDRMLYVSLGDGGAADDQGVGHVPGGNGQEPGNILGSILRLDPDGNDAANGAYGIPDDNPFVGTAGLDEIWAYGFRNPFRISFDGRTGELWAADVGQNDIEEIDVVVPGGNHGWRIKEGTFCFDANGDDAGFVYDCAPGEAPAGLIDPVAEYDHDEGIAVVGGFVYRGAAIPPLRGRYVFGDYLDPSVGSGRVFFLQRNERILELRLAGRDALGLRVLGFGEDADGELYVLANSTGTPFGDTGQVLRIAPVAPPARGFTADLQGASEVPPVATDARGRAVAIFGPGFESMRYRLTVSRLEDPVAAHIHCAPAGQNGPVGVTLFAGAPSGPGPLGGTVRPNGLLDRGVVTAPDEGNACGWTDLIDLVRAIQAGMAYVNVHTTEHPAGEIRGQLR